MALDRDKYRAMRALGMPRRYAAAMAGDPGLGELVTDAGWTTEPVPGAYVVTELEDLADRMVETTWSFTELEVVKSGNGALADDVEHVWDEQTFTFVVPTAAVYEVSLSMTLLADGVPSAPMDLTEASLEWSVGVVDDVMSIGGGTGDGDSAEMSVVRRTLPLGPTTTGSVKLVTSPAFWTGDVTEVTVGIFALPLLAMPIITPKGPTA